ncbi:hypothetical protein NSQ26_09415 [Bacillus sp. FSL W7-1360]
MNNRRPILHISIYYQGNSQIQNALLKKISAYSKRLVEDPCNPLVDIRIDTLDTQEEKQVLLELSYHSVLTNIFVKPLKSTDQFHHVIITLAELTIQRLYEKNPNTGTENWLLISLTPLKESDSSYNIQWCTGYNCCQANHHWDSFQQC